MITRNTDNGVLPKSPSADKIVMNMPKIALVIQDRDNPDFRTEILDLRKFFKSGELTLQDDGELRITVHSDSLIMKEPMREYDLPASDEVVAQRLSTLMDIMETQESDSLMDCITNIPPFHAAKRRTWLRNLWERLGTLWIKQERTS